MSDPDLEELYDTLVPEFGLEEGRADLRRHPTVRREALAQLFEAGTRKDVQQLCAERGTLEAVAHRVVAGIEPPSTFSWLLEALAPDVEQATESFADFLGSPDSIMTSELDASAIERLHDIIDAFVSAGVSFEWQESRCLLDCALVTDIRKDWAPAMVEKIAASTPDTVVASVAERRLAGYYGHHGEDVRFAALQWLLAKRPPEDGLTLGFVSASILSMRDEVRALTTDFDDTRLVASTSTWRLRDITGPGSTPAYLELEAGDDSRTVCGRLYAKLEKVVAGLRVENGPHTSQRLATAEARLEVVRRWPRVDIDQKIERSVIIKALCRLLVSPDELDAVIDHGASLAAQYMEAVRFLQGNPELLRSWPGEHPLGLILRGDGPGLSVVNDLEPEDYPPEAEEWMDGLTHGEYGGAIYCYGYENGHTTVIAIDSDAVVRHGTLEGFVVNGVEALLAAPS